MRLDGAAGEIPVVAVAVRPGRELDVAALERVLGSFSPRERPVVVRVVEQIPMTPGYRPLKGPLRREGVDPARISGRALRLEPETGALRPLDTMGYARLLVTPRAAPPSPFA